MENIHQASHIKVYFLYCKTSTTENELKNIKKPQNNPVIPPLQGKHCSLLGEALINSLFWGSSW